MDLRQPIAKAGMSILQFAERQGAREALFVAPPKKTWWTKAREESAQPYSEAWTKQDRAIAKVEKRVRARQASENYTVGSSQGSAAENDESESWGEIMKGKPKAHARNMPQEEGGKGNLAVIEVNLDHGWVPLETSVLQAIAKAEAQGEQQVEYTSRGFPYKIDLGVLVQTNVQTGKSRKLRRRDEDNENKGKGKDKGAPQRCKWNELILEEGCLGITQIEELHEWEASDHGLAFVTAEEFFQGFPHEPMMGPKAALLPVTWEKALRNNIKEACTNKCVNFIGKYDVRITILARDPYSDEVFSHQKKRCSSR